MILGGLDKTQAEVAPLLEELCKDRVFPNAVLFSGERCSGRMFASRAVCQRLQIPSENVIIVSDRNHSYRIRTAIELYKKHRNDSAKRFLRENVSILLQQYHGALMDGQNTVAAKKKFSDAAEATDVLRELESASDTDAAAVADKLLKALSPLMEGNRIASVSVGQVRAIRDWCATSSMDGEQKFVIIEGLENAGDGAVNALLKTLEEPPEGSHFILISENAGRIPATILSRVRKFRFKSFGPEEKAYVLNSLFVDPSRYEDLQQFFLQGSGIDDRMLSESASALLEKKDLDIPALVSVLEKTQAWDTFFNHVIDKIRLSFTEGKLDQRRTEYLLKAVNEAVTKGKTYNQPKRLTFDFVVYRIREVIR